MMQGMLKKAASGRRRAKAAMATARVLVTRRPRRTPPYASPSSLPAALLDLASRRRADLFEHSLISETYQ